MCRIRGGFVLNHKTGYVVADTCTISGSDHEAIRIEYEAWHDWAAAKRARREAAKLSARHDYYAVEWTMVRKDGKPPQCRWGNIYRAAGTT